MVAAINTQGPAQRPAVAEVTTPLSLRMEIGRIRVRGIPETVTLVLRNRSDHDLAIPEPHVGCADGMYGNLFFWVYVRSSNGPYPMHGCVADYFFAKTSITERIRTWKRLAPGNELRFREIVAAEAGPLPAAADLLVTYFFSAAYDAPFVSEADRRLLRQVKIDVPLGRIEVAPLAFKRSAKR